VNHSAGSQPVEIIRDYWGEPLNEARDDECDGCVDCGRRRWRRSD